MSKENKSRDWLDVVDIFSRAAIPAVIFVLGLIFNNQLTAATRDVDVVQRFSNLYYYEGKQDSRRLSIYYIRLIDNKQTRYELRKFVVWDTLEKNITNGFNFNPEFLDWHMMGDTILDMAKDDPNSAKIFWCDLKSTALERWQTQETELPKLFDWIDNVYKKNDPNWVKCS
jgi:hypothetical protein